MKKTFTREETSNVRRSGLAAKQYSSFVCASEAGMFGSAAWGIKMEKEIIEKFLYCLLLVGLIVETIEDIREKKICLMVVIIELPVLLGIRCWLGMGGITIWVASFGIGALFYLISIATREQIGKGDAFVLCMTGAGIGLFYNLVLIYIAFFLAFVAAVFLWTFKRVNKKYSMPLMPFILCSYLIVVGCQIFG